MPGNSIALSGPLQACHPKPLDGIDDADGHPVVEQDKVAECRRANFAYLFSASIMSDPREDPHCPEQIPPGCSFLKVPVDLKPSLSDVVAAIAALKELRIW